MHRIVRDPDSDRSACGLSADSRNRGHKTRVTLAIPVTADTLVRVWSQGPEATTVTRRRLLSDFPLHSTATS